MRRLLRHGGARAPARIVARLLALRPPTPPGPAPAGPAHPEPSGPGPAGRSGGGEGDSDSDGDSDGDWGALDAGLARALEDFVRELRT